MLGLYLEFACFFLTALNPAMFLSTADNQWYGTQPQLDQWEVDKPEVVEWPICPTFGESVRQQRDIVSADHQRRAALNRLCDQEAVGRQIRINIGEKADAADVAGNHIDLHRWMADMQKPAVTVRIRAQITKYLDRRLSKQNPLWVRDGP